MNIDPMTLLALVADLYARTLTLEAENERLRQQLAERDTAKAET